MAMFTESPYRFLMGVMADVAKPDPVFRKLRSFQNLPAGWSHGEGLPVDHRAVQRAEIFLDLAQSLQLRADVFPGLNAECSVTVYSGDRTVEIIVRPDNDELYGLHVESGLGFQFSVETEKDDATRHEALNSVRSLVPIAWRSSESYRSVSSTQAKVDSLTSYSSNLLAPA